MKGKRIFAAIDLSGEARDRVAAYCSDLRAEFKHLRVRWEPAEKLQITIKFAGYLDDATLKAFIAAAESAGQVTAPFEVTIFSTGSFIKRNGPGVLWLGLESGPLTEIATKFQAEQPVQRPVNERPPRPFKPHLTIARLRDPRASSKLIERHLAASFGPVEFEASGLAVYESKLLSTGSVYCKLSESRFVGR